MECYIIFPMPFPTYGRWMDNDALRISYEARVPQQQTQESQGKTFPDFFLPCGAPADDRQIIGHPRDISSEKSLPSPVKPAKPEDLPLNPPLKFLEFWGRKKPEPSDLICPSI